MIGFQLWRRENVSGDWFLRWRRGREPIGRSSYHRGWGGGPRVLGHRWFLKQDLGGAKTSFVVAKQGLWGWDWLCFGVGPRRQQGLACAWEAGPGQQCLL